MSHTHKPKHKPYWLTKTFGAIPKVFFLLGFKSDERTLPPVLLHLPDMQGTQRLRGKCVEGYVPSSLNDWLTDSLALPSGCHVIGIRKHWNGLYSPSHFSDFLALPSLLNPLPQFPSAPDTPSTTLFSSPIICLGKEILFNCHIRSSKLPIYPRPLLPPNPSSTQNPTTLHLGITFICQSSNIFGASHVKKTCIT